MLYHLLAGQAILQGRCAWKTRPKLHYMAHQILEISDTRENPCVHQLFKQEDHIGYAKRATKRAHRLTASETAVRKRILTLTTHWRKSAQRPALVPLVGKPRKATLLLNNN